MSVNNAAWPRSLGPGTSAPYCTSDYTSQYDPVPGSHRAVGQDTHRYPFQDFARTAMRHPRNAAGYSDQYPVGNAGDYDANHDYYHPIAPSLDSRVIEGPRYPADPYDGFSTKQIQYGQPLRIIAGNGVAGQPLGDYGSQVKSLYEAQQSDDDYQRHNADRNRREGRAQDRFGQRNQGTWKMSEYFLNGEGIEIDVLQREICKFLGTEATARPATHNGMRGFIYLALRPFTPEMLHDLQELSMEYRRDTRTLCKSFSKAAEARAMERGEPRGYS